MDAAADGEGDDSGSRGRCSEGGSAAVREVASAVGSRRAWPEGAAGGRRGWRADVRARRAQRAAGGRGAPTFVVRSARRVACGRGQRQALPVAGAPRRQARWPRFKIH